MLLNQPCGHLPMAISLEVIIHVTCLEYPMYTMCIFAEILMVKLEEKAGNLSES